MKNNKGFTLIELLAVIVILAVIAAIASSSIIKTIERSKRKTGDTARKEIIEIGTAYLLAETADVVTNDETKIKKISIFHLGENGFLDKENLTNPCTGEKWTEDTKRDIFVTEQGLLVDKNDNEVCPKEE